MRGLMYGPVAEELRMCGWGPYTREASVWEACCWCSGVINMSRTVSEQGSTDQHSVVSQAPLELPPSRRCETVILDSSRHVYNTTSTNNCLPAVDSSRRVYNTTVPATCLPHTGFAGAWTPATHAEFLCDRTIHIHGSTVTCHFQRHTQHDFIADSLTRRDSLGDMQ